MRLAQVNAALVDLQGGTAAAETPLVFTIRLLLTGAATGAVMVSIFIAYAVLAPRVRRYVAMLRMRRIRHRRAPPEPKSRWE